MSGVPRVDVPQFTTVHAEERFFEKPVVRRMFAMAAEAMAKLGANSSRLSRRDGEPDSQRISVNPVLHDHLRLRNPRNHRENLRFRRRRCVTERSNWGLNHSPRLDVRLPG